MTIQSLRKENTLEKLLQQVEKDTGTQQEKKSYGDERLWKPEVDKSGNGYAIIRFLPQPEGDDLPWAKVWNHAFQGPTGKWLIENCPTTAGGKCPVCEENSKLWNSGIESDKNIARDRKRKLSYYSNILVVSDSKHPENEGKVFLYKYGKKIFDKIMAAMQPEFEDETPINPFDLWEGANFKLKIRKVDGYWNYDKSEFELQTAVGPSDEEREKLWKSEYSLKEFTSKDNIKSYEELQQRFLETVSGVAQATRTVNEDVEEMPTMKVASAPKMQSVDSVQLDENEDDDAMSYFAKLAQED